MSSKSKIAWEDQYWQDCISEAAEECDLDLTKAQLECLSYHIQMGRDDISMASGDAVASSNLFAHIEREKDDMAKALRREKDKVQCKPCAGSGSITTYGGTFQATSSCWKCKGYGRHDP